MYRSEDFHFYRICGKTYPIKEKIKALGGIWNHEKQYWMVLNTEKNLQELRKLRISLRVKVKREAFCHEPESEVYVDTADLQRGFTEPKFCGNCDSHFSGIAKVHAV